MKRVSFSAGLIVFLWLTFTFLPSAHAFRPYWQLIPYWMDAQCSTYPYCGQGYCYTGYNDTCAVDWAPVDGVSYYYVQSFTGYNDQTVYPPDHERGLGGGSGTLCDHNLPWTCPGPETCSDVNVGCYALQPDFLVYAWYTSFCNTDADCPPALFCQNHVCVPRPPKGLVVNINSRFGKGGTFSNIGDPINAGLGNYIFSKPLFIFPGKGLPFGFEVNYNSLDNTYSGPLGFGWTYTYNVVLTPPTPPSTDVTIKWGDGHEETFHGDGSGNFTPINCTTPVTLTMPDSSHYLATLYNKNTYRFDSSGRLLSIADLNGNQIALIYSATTPNQIDHITDTAGRQIAFTYDLAGRITAITSPLKAGSTVLFQYDGSGNLTGIVDPRGKTWRFTYDSSHRILTQINANGTTVVTNAYDAQSRVSQQTDGANHTTTYAYTVNASGTTTVVTPPSGNAITQTYDLAYNLTSVTFGEGNQSIFYTDSQGRLYNATDKNGANVQALYDASNNPSFAQDRTGSLFRFGSNALNRPTSLTDPLSHTTSFGWDAKGNLTDIQNANGEHMGITVDANGLPTAVTDFRTAKSTWSFAYDSAGLVQTTTDPTGNQTHFTYDVAGRPTQITLPGGGTVVMTYDEAGNLLTRTDSVGNVMSFTYDDNGDLVSRTFVPTGATTSYEYDWEGRLTKTIDALGGVTRKTYDIDGNIPSITDPDGVTVTYQYDKSNRLTSTTDPLGHHVYYGYDPNGNVTSVKNHIENTWTTTFDAEGRPLQTADPLGNKNSTTYDAVGRATSTTDPLGHTVTFQYDAAGRLISTTLPDQGVITSVNDQNGRPLSLTDPLGKTWTLSYDDAGRLVSKRDPNGQTEVYSYDSRGHLTKKVLRDGTTLTYAYDGNGQLTSATMPGQTITYGYDVAGNLTTLTDSSGTTTMTYDKLGRRLTRTDPSGKTVAFTYTAAGRLKTITYPGNKVVTYSYDTAARLSTIVDWQTNQTTFQYDSVNRVTQINLPNGTRTLYTYDAARRVATRSSQKADGTMIASYTYAYDAAGHIVSVQRSEPTTPAFANSNATYSYDPVNRVLTANVDSVSTAYTFDARGNLTSKTAGSTTTTYTYDALNRLSSVSDGTNTTNYTFDAAGNRLAKTFNSSTARYVREGGIIYCILDGSGNVQSYNIYAGSLLYSLDGSGAVKVYHGDERGSVVAITDASQNAVQSYSYDPYGKVVGTTGSLTNAFQYVGTRGVMADENGLYHMQARYYDPDAKRFITEDPLGLSAGLNLYGYVGGDPVNRTDPTGQGYMIGNDGKIYFSPSIDPSYTEDNPFIVAPLNAPSNPPPPITPAEPPPVTPAKTFRFKPVFTKGQEQAIETWVSPQGQTLYGRDAGSGFFPDEPAKITVGEANVEVNENMVARYFRGNPQGLVDQVQHDLTIERTMVTGDTPVAADNYVQVTESGSQEAIAIETENSLPAVLTNTGEAAVSTGGGLLGTVVEGVSTAFDIANPVLITDAYLSAGPVYDSADGKYKSWHQWQVDHWAMAYRTHDPEFERSLRRILSDPKKRAAFLARLHPKPGPR